MSTLEGGRPPGRNGNHKPQRGVEYKPQRDPDIYSLSEEEKAVIRENARQKVAAEVKNRLTDQLLADYVEEERQRLLPEEEMLEIYLDLAPHSPYIMLDGKQFAHGHGYTVKRSVFSVLVEQMNRGWAHDDQTQVTDAKGRRRFRPPMGIGFENFSAKVGPWGANRNLVINSGAALATPSAAIMGIQGAVEGLGGG